MADNLDISTLDSLLEYFNYKIDLCEKYLNTISLDDFIKLINKPNFFKSILQKVKALIIFKDNLEKKQLLLKNIVDNDLDNILVDNYLDNAVIAFIKNDDELLNYFLKILPKDKLNIVLDNWFSKVFYLDSLLFDEENQQIIEEYINCCAEKNDDKKILNLIKVLYKNPHISKNKWGEFILEILFNDERLYDMFFEYYRDLIYPTNPAEDVSYSIPNIVIQEKLVSLFLLMINVFKKISNCNDNDGILRELIELFLKDISDKQSERLVLYLNNIVQSNSYLAFEILKNSLLIQFVNESSFLDYLCYKESSDLNSINKLNKDMTDEDLEKIFINDEINSNLVMHLSSEMLIKLFPFNYFFRSNDKIFDILKEFLRRYVPYEKALFFIQLLNINDVQKQEIFNRVYQTNIENIDLEKDILIANCMASLLKLEDPVSEEFKMILPDLIKLPYDENLFEELKPNYLKIDKLEYLQVVLSQYFKRGCEILGLNYWDYVINYIPMFNKTLGSVCGNELMIYYKKYNSDSNSEQNASYIETSNHEKTHLFQQDGMSHMISMDALMVGFEQILIQNHNYYDKNYGKIYSEVHARMIAFYETYNFLKEIDPDAAMQYLEKNKALNENNDKNNDVRSFIKDRERAKSIEYFADLFNIFFEKISVEQIICWRQKWKTIELITNEEGSAYTLEEIEDRMNSIRSYGTNDIEFNVDDRDTKLFYTKYLHNLRYGIENGLISFNVDNKVIKKS